MSENVNRLITKVQYKTFEPGEFEKEQRRTYDETISLIQNFPWEKQREGIHIDLTCPSITIQDDNSSYLKLSLYYNGKFVLYFFDGENLFSKSYYKYVEAYEDIKIYFETLSIEHTEYKKENLLFKKISRHFISNDFVYYVDPKKPLKGLSSISAFFLLLFFILLVYCIVKLEPDIIGIIAISLVTLFASLPFALEFWSTLNYFRFSKGKILKLSRGADYFKYGDMNNLETFKKSEITEIFVIEDSKRNGPTHSITFLYLKTGNVIKITSLHLLGRDIGIKMPGIKIKTKKVLFPYLKSTEKLQSQ